MAVVLVFGVGLCVGVSLAFGGNMKTAINWLGQHPTVVVAALVCLTFALISAMYFHYDLSWIPDLLQKIVGG